MAVVVSELLNAEIAKVWQAITDPAQMKYWYFDTIKDFRPVVGFETQVMMDSGVRIFNATWKVVEVIQEKRIKYNWSYAEYDGLGPVTFELAAKGDKTLITVINEGLETFPRDLPEFTEDSCKAGWEYFIQQRLPNYLKAEK